jgi:hypothetical protein
MRTTFNLCGVLARTIGSNDTLCTVEKMLLRRKVKGSFRYKGGVWSRRSLAAVDAVVEGLQEAEESRIAFHRADRS